MLFVFYSSFHFAKNHPCILVNSAYNPPQPQHNEFDGLDLSLGDNAVDVSDSLVEDLLEGLGVLELLVDLGDDGVGELLLLAGLDGTLVADPRVEDGLGLVGEVDLLLELVSLGLELGGFLV